MHYPAEYLGDTVESLVIALRSGLTVEQIGVARCGSAPPAARRTARSRRPIYLLRACLALLISLTRRRTALVPGEPRSRDGGYLVALRRRHSSRSVFMVELLRRRRLREKYAALWIAVAVVVLLGACFPQLTDWLAELVGVTDAGQPGLLPRHARAADRLRAAER